MNTPGIVVTFFAALFGAVINVYLFYLKPHISWIPAQHGYQDAVMFIIAAMIVRHQLRVVFLDSSAALHIKTKFRKAALWVLFPLGVVGAVFLMSFAFHVKVGILVTIIYTVLFLLFWLILLIGSFIPGASNEEKERRDTALWGLVVDSAFLVWWWNFFHKVMSGGQGKVEEESFVFTAIILMFVAAEIAGIYKEPLRERYTQLKDALL